MAAVVGDRLRGMDLPIHLPYDAEMGAWPIRRWASKLKRDGAGSLLPESDGRGPLAS